MKHHLIPFPASVIASTGNFVVSNTTGFSIEPSVELEGLGHYLAEQIRETTGIRDIINTAKGEQKRWKHTARIGWRHRFGRRRIRIIHLRECDSIRCKSFGEVFYGIQTLRQPLPAVSMRDTPRFRCRGAMLDVARHFFGVEDITRYISYAELNC